MKLFLDFKKISTIPFEAVLDYYNIAYQRNGSEIKGRVGDMQFIVNVKKNLFFSPNSDLKGSVINFLSGINDLSLREAAAELEREFLRATNPEPKKVPDLTLEYHKFLEEQGISEDTAKEWNCGYCKQGILRGRLAFAIYDKDGQKVAYCGMATKEDQNLKWLFPKGYKHIHIYGLNRLESKEYAEVYQAPIEAIKNNGLAFLTPNATNEQIELLGEIKQVRLCMEHPDNIGLRLMKKTFVKC